MPCQFTVRTAEAIRQWEWDRWSVLAALGGLSAEPETFEEFEGAMRRYQPRRRLSKGVRQVSGLDQAARPGPWCLVDLIGKSVIAGGGFKLPDRSGEYAARGNREAKRGGMPVIWLDIPGDWLLAVARGNWIEQVAGRAREALAHEPLDARQVLFGRPLMEFLADRILASPDPGPSDDAWLGPARQIHAQWLMTPRDDLRGHAPRELLVQDLERIESDLQRRVQQWTIQGESPPPLPVESRAYRFGGIGTGEAVMYFDLIRTLIREAFAVRRRIEREGKGALTRETFAQRLEEMRDEWLATPSGDWKPEITPMEVIECERRRIPLVDQEAIADCDCPICMAEQAQGSGPTFYWIDGYHLEMEDDFAFSLVPSRAEWEERQKEYQQAARQWKEQPSHSSPTALQEGEPGIWQSSYVDWDELSSPTVPKSAVKMAIGFLLAELVTDLRRCGAKDRLVRELNEAYVAFRHAEDPTISRAAAQQLRDHVEQAGQRFPQLVPKSADLQSRLDEVLRRVTANPSG